MNRNARGEILTTEELWEIADLDDDGIRAVTQLHNDNLIHSKLLQITAMRRYQMFLAGELTLDTSHIEENRRTV